MIIQLALDRLTIDEAIELGKMTEDYVDWIEVGTSLIKEYGMASVERVKEQFPSKTVIADIKTMDNAKYEFEICFKAGADIATVMGVSPLATVNACVDVAKNFSKGTMIDLLNTNKDQKEQLFQLAQDDIYFCEHVSKDEQEVLGKSNDLVPLNYGSRIKLAVAGGINMDSLPKFAVSRPAVVIIGSAITKAIDPHMAAKAFSEALKEV
ncbi:3-hexulose-6-phosphate synthase [Paenibacillus macerans]|uniref:3-hexulose-6-phosphate synthase n=1 Tax=Paenibacillus macerans TaxID=44252 RepID=UPI00204000FA|nr:3-hexulose-6-phosphate synthase [Paenibacillus macerans]MCM3697830.1 orotidine 5'-phosphate decarboxylase [Paenibacillus macerans]